MNNDYSQSNKYHLSRVGEDTFVELDDHDLAKLRTAVYTVIENLTNHPQAKALLTEYSNLLEKLNAV